MAVDDSYTKSLLHFNGANGSTAFNDESGKLWSPYQAQLTSSGPKFGTACGSFSRGNSYIYTPDHTDFHLGTDDFTIDVWLYFNSTPTLGGFYSGDGTYYGSAAILWPFSQGGNALGVYISSNGGGWDIAGAKVVDPNCPVGEWVHYALVRSGTTFYTFKNGVQQDTWSNSSGIYAGGANRYLNVCSGYGFECKADEFRWSKGIARWTAGFTPPTGEYGAAPPFNFNYSDTPLSMATAASAESLLLDFDAAPLVGASGLYFTKIESLIIDFSSAPLEAASSLEFTEALLLDFTSAPLEATCGLKFREIELDFNDIPFETIGSSSLSEIFHLDMGAAPLNLGLSFDPAFRGRITNRVAGAFPAFAVSGTIEVRSAGVEGTLPAFTVAAHVLSGEIAEVSGSFPAFSLAARGMSHEVASVSGNSPTFKVYGQLLNGSIGSANVVLPAFKVSASGYQTPLISVAGSIPAFMISASGHGQASPSLRQFHCTVLNLKTMALTRYQNFNFNSLCYFNGLYLGANEKGIFVLGGETDDGASIDWSFKTPKLDLLNAIPADVWLSMRNSQPLRLKVEQNEDIKNPYTYPIDADTDPQIHMERVKLGRGLNARIIQMELSGSGPIDLNGMAIVTNPLKKSKR